MPAATSNTQPAFAWRAREHATALAVSRDEAQHARLQRARAMPHWWWSVHTLYKATSPARGLSPSAQVRAATCQLRSPTQSRHSRGAHASAPLRSLSIRRRRSTRACEAHARCWAGCSRSVPQTRPLHRRESSLHRRKTVLRRVSCSLQHTAGFRVARMRARQCAHYLSRRGAARALAKRARHAALVVVGSYPTQGHCTGEKPLSLGARPWCAVLAAASKAQPAFRVARTQARHCARYLWGRGAARALAKRARRAALDVITA